MIVGIVLCKSSEMESINTKQALKTIPDGDVKSAILKIRPKKEKFIQGTKLLGNLNLYIRSGERICQG